MRKCYFILLSVLITCCSSFGQFTSPVFNITHDYFRSDPFQKEFSSFLSHLLNDPSISGKVLEKRTDTSLFYFQGLYKNHNPFFFKPKRTEVILTEMPVELDSLHTDTIYTYQLIAYTDNTKEGDKELKKEFEKIFKRFKGGFFKYTFTESPARDELNGATYNFFDRLCAVAPFALTWSGPDKNKEMYLILTVRMSTHNNITTLPVPLYTF